MFLNQKVYLIYVVGKGLIFFSMKKTGIFCEFALTFLEISGRKSLVISFWEGAKLTKLSDGFSEGFDKSGELNEFISKLILFIIKTVFFHFSEKNTIWSKPPKNGF